METEFIGFPKISRYSRECIITEKIDGTNAQIVIGEDGSIRAGCRTRFITPEADNFGFARWVHEHPELVTLGPGRHFGEWWGAGIQRGYGLQEKRFSLFNVHKFGPNRDLAKYPIDAPACCSTVPVLWRGPFDDSSSILWVMKNLEVYGSYAEPGFMQPEGIVIFHTASGTLFKKTFEKDAGGKEN
jgi:hypothetical protein